MVKLSSKKFVNSYVIIVGKKFEFYIMKLNCTKC